MQEIPKTMAAVVTTGHGGLEKLVYREDWPVPAPKPGDVLIKVGACGLNNTDINTRTAWYSKEVTEGTHAEGGSQGFASVSDEDATWGGKPVSFPRIQGADVCGRIVAVGDGVPGERVGERVLIDTWFRDWNDPDDFTKAAYFGSEIDGGYAQFTVAPSRNVHAVESVLGDEELATFATSYVTAENLLERAAVAAGDVVLITGASGGVGSALIQLARRRGARPVGLSSLAKAEQLREIGAEAVLEREPGDLAAAMQAAIGQGEVDVVADVVGGAIFAQLIEVLRQGGRYTCAGAIAGPIVTFDLRSFYLKDLVFTGATVVPPGLFAKLVGYIERGEITPLLARSWPLGELREAQEAFLQKRHIGNFVAVPPA